MTLGDHHNSVGIGSINPHLDKIYAVDEYDYLENNGYAIGAD